MDGALSGPDERAKQRQNESFLDRAIYCANQLAALGFVKDKERRRIHQRMVKWKALWAARRKANGRT